MIVLDLPAPLSVNRTRKIDWAAKPKIAAWVKAADMLVMSQGRLPKPISGQFQVTVTLPEDGALDLDNTPKMVIDYLRRLELIANDNPKHMRRVVLEFGEAPEGCRISVKSLEPEPIVACFWPNCEESFASGSFGHARKLSECQCQSVASRVSEGTERGGSG